MTHDEVKKMLFEAAPELKREYDKLKPAYNIADTLIQARIDNSLTQRELARRCGTRQSNISRLESGEANPSLAMLQKIAEATGTELVIEFRKTGKQTDAAKASEASTGKIGKTNMRKRAATI